MGENYFSTSGHDEISCPTECDSSLCTIATDTKRDISPNFKQQELFSVPWFRMKGDQEQNEICVQNQVDVGRPVLYSSSASPRLTDLANPVLPIFTANNKWRPKVSSKKTNKKLSSAHFETWYNFDKTLVKLEIGKPLVRGELRRSNETNKRTCLD